MAEELKQAVNRVPEEAEILEEDECEEQPADSDGAVQLSVRPRFNQIPDAIGKTGEPDDNQSSPFVPGGYESETDKAKIHGAKFLARKNPVAQGGQEKDRKGLDADNQGDDPLSNVIRNPSRADPGRAQNGMKTATIRFTRINSLRRRRA